MPKVSDLKNSKFLTKHDAEPPVLVTISGFEELNVAMESQDPEMKWVLKFKEFDKPLVLNMTNGQLIAAITGTEEFEGWIGEKVVLFNDPTISFGGKLTGGIRIRAMKTAGPTNVPETVGRPVDHVPPITEDEIPF